MKKIEALLFAIFIAGSLYAQDISDSERLSKMEYMKYAAKINCDSTSGSNLEHRICLNLEFQKLDALLNEKFKALLQMVAKDSLRNELVEFQMAWVNNRRLQSEIVAEGSRGHMLGIIYLAAMVHTTQKRIEEIEFYIKRE